MTDTPLDRVRASARDIEDVVVEQASENGANGSATLERGAPALPPGFPVQPLGAAQGRFWFLNARSEMVDYSAGALAQRATIVALLAGVTGTMDWLQAIAPPKGRNDHGFNASRAADALMQACAALPLFDSTISIRHFGTWRGPDGAIVVHLGESIETEAPRHGRLIGRALYPAVPGRDAAPAPRAAGSDDIAWVVERWRRYWAWGDPTQPDALVGWIGQAALGQFPAWRTHCWIKGRLGSGKTALLGTVASLLGGMSPGVEQSASAAAIRQSTNRQAIARLFDEAEADGTGQMEQVIQTFRLMSDASGATIRKGTSDHTGIAFNLYGAGLMASIIPGAMAPQDRSRFIVLSLRARPASDDPADAAARLAELEADAQALGPAVWRRMIALAPARWDVTFRFYSNLISARGATARAGDTIGAILAGWDLMLHDVALLSADGSPDRGRVERALVIAQPLMDAALEAETESEGERCLRRILAHIVSKDHGNVESISEQVERAMTAGGDRPDGYANLPLARYGLRMMDGPPNQRSLFVASNHPGLDLALRGSRWIGGGHRAALETLDGVTASSAAVRLEKGTRMRGLLVPPRYLPTDEGMNS